MNLTGLDITLQRINTIENRFQSLMSYGVQPDEDFQKIQFLTAKIRAMLPEAKLKT